MAAEYWKSTQARFWTFTTDELAEMRKGLRSSNVKLHNMIRLPDDRLMSIYVQQQMVKLGKKLSLRQQALATAQIYVRRFYLRVELRRTNPFLVLATAVYLACKTEECPVHIKVVLAEAQRAWPDQLQGKTTDDMIQSLGECEFVLIGTLGCQLVLHHPYRELIGLAPLLGLSHEETALAWCIVNDHYNTDLALSYAPLVIAFAAVFLAVAVKPVAQNKGPATTVEAAGGGGGGIGGGSAMFQGLSAMLSKSTYKTEQVKIDRLVDFFAESNVDLNAVMTVTQDMISLYDVWELYSDRPIKEAFARIVKEGGGGGVMV